ncbi:MAG: hypothetical protein K2W96_09665 [Gemmataceae bacterium]|nr:hypothetical protein [Gemmataceae bacterium]
MATFSIFRTGEATIPLKAAWEEGDDELRRSIICATQKIDHQLAADPADAGESRDENQRILFSFPVGVLFEIDQDQKRVNILRAWAYNALARG